MTVCLTVTNQKGGVGKTTITANLGAGFAMRGRNVLVIDLDPQANLTLYLDTAPALDEPTVYDVLIGQIEMNGVIMRTRYDGLDIVPSRIDLSAVEVEFISIEGREYVLKRKLEPVREGGKYDYVLLDCPPSMGLISINALTAADKVLIPVQTEFLPLQGLTHLLRVVERVRTNHNPGLQVEAILPTLFDTRTRLSKEVLEELRKHFGGKVLSNHIRRSVKFAEAASHGRSIFEYAPRCAGAGDFERVADELLERLESSINGVCGPTPA